MEDTMFLLSLFLHRLNIAEIIVVTLASVTLIDHWLEDFCSQQAKRFFPD